MAGRIELESMITRLIGDASSYVRMLEEAQQATIKAAGDITKTLAAIGPRVSAAFAQALGSSVREFAKFELHMSIVEGLVGIAQDQTLKLTDAVLKLDRQVGIAPTELADALFYITSAGLRGQKAIDTLTMSAKASVAGLGTTQAVADA